MCACSLHHHQGMGLCLLSKIWALFDWYAGFIVTNDDSPMERKRKRTMLGFFSMVGPMCPFVLITGTFYYKLACLISACVCVTGTVWLFATKSCSPRFIKLVLAAAMLSIMLGDLSTVIITQPRNWPMFIIVIDLMLVLELDRGSGGVAVTVILVWLALTTTENGYRFGLYDLPSSPEDKRRAAVFDCEGHRLPCPIGAARALPHFLVSCMVFLLDFYFTRKFAHDSIEERRKVTASISTAKSIATSLARYNLSDAQQHLKNSVDLLPHELYTAFETLLENLKHHKPYLQHSQFCNDDDDPTEDEPMPELPVPDTPVSYNSRSQSERSSFRSKGSREPEPIIFQSLERPPSKGQLLPHLRKQKITMMLMTVRTSFEGDSLHFVECFNRCLSIIYGAVKQQKGLVDCFTGEQVFVAFNSLRSCVSHAMACARAAQNIQKLISYETDHVSLSVGMSSGQALFGDLGTVDAKRFIHTGKTPLCVKAIEQYARSEKGLAVCDTGVYSDACVVHEMQLVMKKFVLGGYMHPDRVQTCLYKFHMPSGPMESVSAGEWMYKLQNTAGKRWEAYNDAGKLYLRSGPSDTALQMVGLAEDNEFTRSDQVVLSALRDLAALITAGAKPEVVSVLI
eukprot:TRINITY_DN922_c1_g2_i1.p1 TRINITY_DN922_c1_g2~~TRINITY_DN922_c1_g2_i1.p1  ORF type:complete len:625 (+),score=141.18 TRINITY_DN922_c1_g2_i1:122-1996(+)